MNKGVPVRGFGDKPPVKTEFDYLKSPTGKDMFLTPNNDTDGATPPKKGKS